MAGQTTATSRARKFKIGEMLAWVVSGVLLSRFAFISLAPWVGVAIGISFGALGVLGALGRLQFIAFRRWRTAGLFWLALIIGVPSTQDFATRTELADLKATSTSAYLQRLKELGQEGRWLSELQSLDPQAYRSEMGRRQLEKSAAETKRQAAQVAVDRWGRQTAIQELAKADYADFSERLRDAPQRLEDAQLKPPQSVRDIDQLLRVIDDFAEVIAEAEEFDLTDEQRAIRSDLKSRLASLQKDKFPAWRDALASIMKKDLWEHDGTASATGPGNRTLELTAPKYVLNASIQDDYRLYRRTLLKLRFTSMSFRPSAEDGETAYRLSTAPADDKVIYWEDTIPNEVQ